MLIAPYGSWTSPITSDLIVKGSVSLGQPAIDGDDVLWTEVRPGEGGRSVLVRRTGAGVTADVTPPGWNARTRVHEYGGGDYVVDGDTVYFSSYADQRVHRQERGEPPRPLTPAAELRYADYQLDRRRGRLLCVREDKRLLTSREDVNTIVAVPLDGDETGGRVLVSGREFYFSPRLSPDGKQLAWLTWDFPFMAWDAAELWLGDVGDDGDVTGARRIAGGPQESIFQPEWSPGGELYFASDRTDFWNLYRLRGGNVEAVSPYPAEMGAPQWVFGAATYAFVGPRTVLAACSERGLWRLAEIDTETGALEQVASPYSWISTLRGAPGRAVFVASAPSLPPAIVAFDLASRRFETLRRSTDVTIAPEELSLPQAIEFPTDGGVTAHGFFYRPASRDTRAPEGERPPLIVKVHGGPTSAAHTSFSLAIQFWTSRGFAVLDLNYGGSTGYGRAYRERLKGQWGIVDVADSVNGAQFLVARGEVDGARLAISGGSAGGYTTLRATTTTRAFAAGASHYGISDLSRLANDARTGNNHKFESRYEDLLIAPLAEHPEVYRARSPIHDVERLACPVIFFQGLEDRIVLPNQAELMVAVLRDRRLPFAYVPFAGEGHGFRRAENIKRALDAELWFYGKVFGFTPADAIEPVPVENM